MLAQSFAASLPPCKSVPYDFSTESHIQAGVGNVGYPAYRDRAQRRNCRKEWTFLVFMNVDPDLTAQANWDLHEMEAKAGAKASFGKIGSTAVMDAVVEVGYRGENVSRRLHMHEGVCPFLATQGQIKSFNQATKDMRGSKPQEFKRLYGQCPGIDAYKGAFELHTKAHFDRMKPEHVQSPIVQMVELATPLSVANYEERLEAFLKWGLSEYPSEHYALVIWGHGQGFGMMNSHSTRFTGSEAIFGDAPAIRKAIESVRPELPLDPVFGSQRLDLLITNSCLMQMAEVASEFDQTARFVVGSQQVMSGVGFPYRPLFYEVNSRRYVDPKIKMCGLWREGKDNLETIDDKALRLARRIPCQYELSLVPKGSLGGDARQVEGFQGILDPDAYKNFTISSVSTDGVRDLLAPALLSFGEAITAYLDERDESGKFVNMERVFNVENGLRALPVFLGGSRDVGVIRSFFEYLLSEEASKRRGKSLPPTRAMFNLRRASEELRYASAASTIEWIQGPTYTRNLSSGFPNVMAAGIAVWVPPSAEVFALRIKTMSQSRLYEWSTRRNHRRGSDRTEKTPGWPSWMAYLFGLSG